jgi:hypothetical protein
MVASRCRRPAAALMLNILLVVAAGCDSRGLVPVEGRITFAGQQPPASGYVFFVPVEAPAKGDGLRPGTYEARVRVPSVPRRDRRSLSASGG